MNLVTFPISRTFRDLERLANGILTAAVARPASPAYDLRRNGEDGFVLTLAVPGFAEADLDIAVEGRKLSVTGRTAADSDAEYVRRGIARGPFAHSFVLGEHVQVKGAKLENGLLHVELARELPEALKPRQIAIAAGAEAA
ncbi:MAG TPA: Hsp20 family protein [Geminicoccaceae bacterium]|nr:Hsp20 family protein [Geminicoccaceae bacterium]